ncbi:MAG: hypothetical protein LQ343_003683 [Gyalolechia ehrenbergii]|nr:MAG: hypothetical protein LQ343_003683 [Gyalolechia ehrenbergii]
MDTVHQPDIFVAPLQITKDCSRTPSNTSSSSQRTLTGRGPKKVSHQGGQFTPPLTPQSSEEDLQGRNDLAQTTFQTYLRAFHSFHPTCDENSSTVTLPLNYGDIILVHSVHSSGWADGTLLSSGARGWLPTNYCEAYNSEPARILLKALTKFWDLAKGSSHHGLGALANQDYVRGLVAGVRCLLVSDPLPGLQCHSRPSESNPRVGADKLLESRVICLRRNRKALLSELSSFVKTARLLEGLSAKQNAIAAIDLTLDEIIMKAFKVVIRGVKFLDMWDEDLVQAQSFDSVRANDLVPPTPPADCADFAGTDTQIGPDLATTCHFSGSYDNVDADSAKEQTSNVRPSYNRSSHTSFRPGSIDAHAQIYCKQPISHRLSISGHSSAAFRSRLASTKLGESHDAFLGFLGSFIGLHLQSRSSSDLLLTTQQSVISCQTMLRVVEEILDRDQHRSELLRGARDDMYGQIYDLVEAARNIFRPSRAGEDEDVILPAESKALVDAATACVRAAGDCVTESRYVMEQNGDFVFEPLGLDPTTQESGDPAAEDQAQTSSLECGDNIPTTMELPIPAEPTFSPPPPPSEVTGLRKCDSDTTPETCAVSSLPMPEPGSDDTEIASNHQSSHSLLPPLPVLAGSLLAQEDYSPSVQSSFGSSSCESANADSLDIASFGGSSTHIGSLRDSESSAVSQTSTRATSPDHTYGASSLCESFTTSQGTTHDECEEAEFKVLEKTFAHELVFNKDGQISGGTLPALIERLTTHDSTPDASFVSTFYLTFRLFATPIEFAQALIDRFQYVGESPSIAGPVRLRVYNIFKGWLESHWRNDYDNRALELIVPFATRQLMIVLPTAGKRLAALAEKVNTASGPLVPRLVSSMGKTNTSLATYIAPDTPLPPAAITKHQLNLLRNWKHNGATISILDFDPFELARQFTLKVSQIFCSVLPEELLATEWTKKTSSMAVNVRAMSRLSTDLANLVADSILQLEDPKKRATIIKQWVKIAKKFLQLENYDSLMAIICSLNSSTILRLKRTWDQVSSKTKAKLDELKGVVDVSRNYAVLRQRLQNTVPPCLPFVGTYLTDLTFVDVGNQTTRQLSLDSDDTTVPVINFGKHMKTAKIISELQRFQIPYRFTEVPELQTWVQDQLVRVRSSEQANVQNYYRRSLLLEPRETTHRPH